MKKFKPITHFEFEKIEKNDPYYSRRWNYYKQVIDIIKTLSFRSVLELGPYKRSIVHGADVMDKRSVLPNLTYGHDATQIPWPIKDKKYDLFIALQVWEHLKGKQREAFHEVIRVSKMAILSFPLNWHCPGNCHHGITQEKIADWTCNKVPTKKIKVGNWFNQFIDRNLRIIYLFKFK